MNQQSGQVEGSLEAFSLFDLTQSLMMGRRSATVSLESEGRKGWLHLQEGQIIAAMDHTLVEGEKAAMTIFSWTTGTFCIDFEARTPVRNIETPTDSLLMEVARNVDEVRRDKGLPAEGLLPSNEAHDVEDEVTHRFENKLQEDLSGAFKRVAEDTAPSRQRYSSHSFDALLKALLDLEGRVLFLREGLRPRVRSDRGFSNLRDEEIGHDEISGFLTAVLTREEQEQLRERKEVTTFFSAPNVGAFRLTALDAHGSLLVTFSPTAVAVPLLEDFPLTSEEVAKLAEVREGLVVVAGSLGSGKAATVTAMIDEHMERHGSFACEFTNATGYSTETDKGFVIRRGLPSTRSGLHEAIQNAVWQGPDILALVGAPEHDGIELGLGAAGPGRLVLVTLESHSLPDTLRRLARVGGGDDTTFLKDTLAERLRLVLHLEPGRGDLPESVALMEPGRETSEALRTGDLEVLRRGFGRRPVGMVN